MAELEWMLGFPPYLESMVKNLGSCFDKPNETIFATQSKGCWPEYNMYIE